MLILSLDIWDYEEVLSDSAQNSVSVKLLSTSFLAPNFIEKPNLSNLEILKIIQVRHGWGGGSRDGEKRMYLVFILVEDILVSQLPFIFIQCHWT